MKFTSHRDHVVTSTSGHAVAFKKGVPTHVPKAMHHEVLAAGAVPANVDEVEFEDGPKGNEVVVPTDPAERNELIRMTLANIKTGDARDDFTANGVPKMKVVTTALGFEVSAREIADQWQALLQAEADAANGE